ncbi:MAG TPA: SPOR domain-containing protein [Myxococcota bacterium]|nr:SPOR domain-containing protein [Myxococcota bacterium]HQP95918.1 SPOR domain-containing protein [Myxococcota bacterium]
MENDDQRVDGGDEGGGPPHGSRGTDRIRLRDYDRIQEREPFQLRPVHVKTGIALALTLIVAGVIAGWMIGRSDRLGKKTAHEGAPVEATADQPGMPAGSAGTGQSPAAGTQEASPGRSNNVRGSVLPLPSPSPRGADAPIATRRSQVEVPSTGKELSEDATVSDLWPGLLVTTCDFSCISPDGDCGPWSTIADKQEPAPVPAPVGELSFAPTPDPVPDPVPAPVPDPARVGELSFAPTPAPAKVSKAPAREPAKAVAPTKRYVVQIRSFKEEKLANEFADQIRQKGYNPFIVPYTDAAGTTWYRVRTGSFDNAAAASTFAADLNAKESEKSIPVEVK